MKKKQTTNFLQLELLWWAITIALTALLILPIYTSSPSYTFFWLHILYIVSFITLSRHLFFLRFTFLAYRPLLKLILFFLVIPFVFYLVQELNFFQTYLDENGPEYLLGKRRGELTDLSLVTYIRTQILFFGIGSIITAILFGFRMIISIWRNRNRGTV